jgi:hypothetical protein
MSDNFQADNCGNYLEIYAGKYSSYMEIFEGKYTGCLIWNVL